MMLKFKKLEHDRKFKDGNQNGETVFHLYRAKIPGGWLVLMKKSHYDWSEISTDTTYSYGWGYGGATFVPDPNHVWDGSSLD